MKANQKEFNVKNLVSTSIGRKHDITIEEVKELESFKDLSNNQVNELISVIKTFTIIAFNTDSKITSTAKVIEINTNTDIKTKAA